MTTARRILSFHDLEDAAREAESLRAGGYQKSGQWDLAQTCGHLADWMTFPLDGFPRQPWPVAGLMAVIRATVGRRTLRRILESGQMPAGGPTLRATVPPPGGDEAAAVERFCGVVRRFAAHTGPLHPSPLFGAMDRATSTRLQLIHCAHHLGFLVPR